MYETTTKLPKHVELSNNLKDGTTHYLVVQYFGRPFYLPITRDISRALNLTMDGKFRKEPFKIKSEFDREQFAEHAIRDIISALYLQCRDNVLDEIEEGVKRDVLEKIGSLMARPIREEIERRAEDKERLALPESNQSSQPTGDKPSP